MRLILVILLIAQLGLRAQTADRGIIFQPSQKEILANNDELTGLTIKIANHTSNIISGNINILLPSQLELVSRNEVAISVKPGDSIYVPVKIYVTQKVLAGKTNLIRLTLFGSRKQVLGTDTCNLQVAIKKNMTLFAMVTNILLERSIDSIRIPVRISNMGNTAQRINVINRYPSSVESGDFHTSLQLTIPALTDTLIHFVKAVNNRMLAQDAFDVNITGLYSNGELFGGDFIKIQNARGNRSFTDQSHNDSYDNNSISLSSQGLFRPNEVYILQGRGLVEFPHSKLSYNMDATTYKNSSYSPSLIRNTYLGYQRHNMGLQIGNINKAMDINLSGRGGMFYANDTARNNQYEGGYINANSNLFGRAYTQLFPTGEAAWGTFIHKEKRWKLASSMIYELNPMLEAKNMILSNEINWKGEKDLRLNLSFNTGYTGEYNNKSDGTYRVTDNKKLSFSSGLEISGAVNRLIFNSTNYFSSGYYPGTRRGALNLSERITLTRAAGQIWVNADYYKYTPKYFSDIYLFESSFSNLRVDMGWSQKIFKTITLSVAPYYALERNNSFKFISENDLFLRSWNIITTLNIPISSSQYISINTDAGMFNSSFESKRSFRFRSSSNYRFGPFNVMASIQTGMFYLGEIVNNYLKPTDGNYIINITPTVQKSFFRNKLRTEMGINYNNTKLSGKSWQLTGRTEYDIIAKTSLFASMNHNRYTFFNEHYNSSILEVGIKKRMRSAKVGAKINPLTVFVFKDINQNGIYDNADSVATDYLVYINDVVFVTRADGTVLYKGLPPGAYRLTLPRIKGWYTPDRKINFEKKERIEIPLHKTGTLKGQISYNYNEFSYEIARQKQGIVVTAINENGQNYITRTNSDGSYIFFMPTGRYQVRIASENLPPEIENLEEIQTEVLPGEIKSINFILNIKQRRIETKKFSSTKEREQEKDRERERDKDRDKQK